MRLIEVIEGDDTSAETAQARGQLRPGDPQAADPLRRGARASSSTASSTPASRRSGATRRRQGLVDQADRRGRRRGQRRADGPVPPRRHARPRHRRCTSPSTCATPTATASTSTRAWRSSSSEGKLGAKTGGEGFYTRRRAEPRGRRRARRRRARRALHAEGASSRPASCSRRASPAHRDIDLGMMAGAGMVPRRGLLPPFMKADFEGLDDVLARARERRGASTASASRRRSCCAGSSPRAASGRRAARASTPTRSPTTGYAGRDGQARDARRRRDRVARQPADELDLARRSIERPAARRGRRSRRSARARAGPRLAEPAAVLRRRRHQGVHADGRGRRAASCSTARTRCCASSERSGDRHDRRGQRPRVRRRLRARDGLRRAHRRAARRSSASPRSSSGSSPASAARSGCRGSSGANKALEMNLTGDADRGRGGLRVRPRQPRRARPRAVRHRARSGRASSPARRRWRSSRSSRSRAKADLDEGIEAEKAAFATVVRRRGRARGHRRLPRQAHAEVAAGGEHGRVDRARRAHPRGRLGRRAHRRGDLGAVRDPRLPLARAPGCGRTSTRWRSPTSTSCARDPERFWHFYGHRFATLRGQAAQRRAPRAGRARAPRAPRRRRSRRTSTGCTAGAGTRELIEVHGSIAHSSCLACGGALPAGRGRASAWPPTRTACRAATAAQPLKPDVVLFGELLPEAAHRARLRAGRGRRPAAVRRLLARGLPGRRSCRGVTRAARRRASRSSPRARRRTTTRAAVKLDGDVVAELEAVVAAL